MSSMPDNVITNILDRLPIQYAVRTDVLSKNWRYKSALLTQIIFDANFFVYLQRPYDYYQNPDEPYKYNGRDINRFLLHLKGPITKFVLYIPHDNSDQLMDVWDIYHWVLFLSRKGIKDFTFLYKPITKLFQLPTQLFSCTELQHLKLESCCLRPSPSFSGFPNLLSLDLYYVTFESYMCGEFLARCPLLEILKISMCGPIAELELNEIAKMSHLNLLKLDSLSLTFLELEKFAQDGVQEFSIAFPCLETLTLSNVHFDDDVMISFLFGMICGSPNLQTLEILATYDDNIPPSEFFPHIYLMGQLQLQSVVFGGFRGSESEAYLIEFLLARSPLLEKFGIGLDYLQWLVVLRESLCLLTSC